MLKCFLSVTCPIPVSPTNGRLLNISGTSNSGGYLEDSKAYFECDANYTISGSPSLCRADRTWSSYSCIGKSTTSFGGSGNGLYLYLYLICICLPSLRDKSCKVYVLNDNILVKNDLLYGTLLVKICFFMIYFSCVLYSSP